MAKSVHISCQAAATVPFKNIKPFQGELKSLSKESFAKLKTLILKNGVTAPIHVWKSKGVLYNLDGHQRCRLFAELEKDGYKVPPVPIVYVTAKDIKQAKQILLSNVSQYGKIEAEGLYEFLQDLDIKVTVADIDLPDFDLPKFMTGYFESNEAEGEGAVGAQELSSSRFETFHVKCPKCAFEFNTERGGEA